MEPAVEEHAPAVVKGKRTKRRRQPVSPMASSASSASSSESTTTEEEDMAHCLILLAQGRHSGPAADVESPPPAPPRQLALAPAPARSERYTSRRYTEAAATADGGKAGFYVYECKTCNKCFPSFQALGGHRASHKKPRLAAATSAADDKKPSPSPSPSPSPLLLLPPPPAPSPADAAPDAADAGTHPRLTMFSLNAAGAGAASGGKLRVHECSICGAEFASGQALGGHMRRHRPLNAMDAAPAAAEPAAKKERSLNLELDLNLPAPSDEESPPPPPFQFDGKRGLMLTASALVDCHY